MKWQLPLAITLIWAATASAGCGTPAFGKYSTESALRKAHRMTIIGGHEATPGEFPWQIAMYLDGSFSCGGSLITKNWVMTAAHCILGATEKPETLLRYKLIAGEHNIKTGDIPDKSVRFNPIKIIGHPKFSFVTLANDIALMKIPPGTLDGKLGDRINTVCLHVPGVKPKPGTNCTVTGWGYTKQHSDPSDVLMEVQIKILEDRHCREYEAYQPGMMCAGILAGGKDSCSGDSGGPLVCPVTEDGNTRSFEVGIVSFGRGCAQPNWPGVYTDINYYADWITDVIKTN